MILDVVERDGEISRNQSLAMFIPRLPSRIADLKELGFRFQGGRRGDDYVYKLVARPHDLSRSLADVVGMAADIRDF